MTVIFSLDDILKQDDGCLSIRLPHPVILGEIEPGGHSGWLGVEPRVSPEQLKLGVCSGLLGVCLGLLRVCSGLTEIHKLFTRDNSEPTPSQTRATPSNPK